MVMGTIVKIEGKEPEEITLELLIEIIDNLDLAFTTKKNYKSHINVMYKDFDNSLDFIDKPKKIIEYLNNLNSMSTKRGKATTLLTIFREAGLVDIDTITQLRKYVDEELNKKFIKKEFNPEITLQEVQEIVSNIEDRRDRLILDLYVNYPPLRGDFFSVKLDNYSVTDNYYDSEIQSIVFNNTIKTGKKIIFPLNQNTINLFPDSDDLFPFQSADGLTKALRRASLKYFGEEYGIHFFRKLYASTELKGKIALDEKAKNLALRMNHSSNIQTNFYLHDL